MKLHGRLILIALMLVACHREAPVAAAKAPAAQAPVGDAEHGKQLITQYGCYVCHITPGVAGPKGIIGPSLAGMASRPMLSNNTFPNTPENVARFIRSPASMNPNSAMPPLAVNPVDAQDLTAYLMTLK